VENFAEMAGHGGAQVGERGNGAGPHQRVGCSELGDMSSNAPRRCCGTSSRGRAHTEEGHRRAPLNRKAGEGVCTLTGRNL
jgi:hypothetical protein